MTAIRVCLFAILMAISCQAQNYWTAWGAGFNQYSDKQVSGWTSFGVKISDNNYSYTTIETTANGSSTRTGVARVLLKIKGFRLLALGDAGASTNSSNFGGAYSGGGVLTYDVSKLIKQNGIHIVFTARALNGSVINLQPVFSFGIGKAF